MYNKFYMHIKTYKNLNNLPSYHTRNKLLYVYVKKQKNYKQHIQDSGYLWQEEKAMRYRSFNIFGNMLLLKMSIHYILFILDKLGLRTYY